MDIKLIKELREKTGAGMANCKEALIETGGDIEKAIEYLRKKGAATAAKRAEKVAKEGAVKIAVSEDKKSASIIELNCETDFVSKGEKFQKLSEKIANICLKNKVKNVDDALKTKDENNLTVKDNIDDLVASVGEKVELRRVKFVEISDGFVSSYLHFGSKLGGLVIVRGEYTDSSYDLGNKISMQVVAMNPMAITRDGIPTEVLEKEKEIYVTVAKGENKPEHIIQKIVENKLEKFYQENCLLEQEYINEANLTIGELIKRFEKENGTRFEVVEIVRFQLGM
ncbi:MAG: translation elongation factor Ts [Ignavibacteria bacterium]|nr:translation elongation factor Ts [Ignavibacteria bacterium]